MASSTIWAPIGDKGPDGDQGPPGIQGPPGPSGGVSLVIDLIGTLKALTGVGTATFVFVTGYSTIGDGGGGYYRKDALDVSSPDNGGTVLVDIAGGRWKLQQQQPPTFKQFGAIGNGIADDTTAIQNCLNAVTVWRKVRAPAGTYKFSQLTIPNYVMVEGDGEAATILTSTKLTSGVSITVNTAAKITNCGLTHSSDPTGVTMVKLAANRAAITDCQLSNCFCGIQVGDAATHTVGNVIDNINAFSPKAGVGSGVIFLQNYSTVSVTNVIAAGAAYPTQQTDFGIRVHNGDTGYIDKCNITNHGFALYMDVPVSLNNYALRISNSLFDSAGTTASTANPDSALLIPAGNIYDMLVTNTWFGLSNGGSGCNVTRVGAGTVDGLVFTGCQFVKNAQAGLAVISTGVINWKVTGGYATGNVVYGLRVAANCGRFDIESFTAAPVAGRGANGRGINIDTGTSDNYTIVGCRSQFSTVFNFFDGGTGTTKVVANNLTT